MHACICAVLPTPEDVVVSICEEASTSKVLRMRHASRLLPITHSCYASVEEMKKLAPRVLRPHFPDGMSHREEKLAQYMNNLWLRKKRPAPRDTYATRRVCAFCRGRDMGHLWMTVATQDDPDRELYGKPSRYDPVKGAQPGHASKAL
eukprot:scaffold240456_cov18-Tisochrysis_lutea.AAC.2